MKKTYLFLMFNLCLVVALKAQSTQENLNKYWYYRDRLKKYFVVVDPSDGFGTNVPFTSITKDNENNITMGGGDGNDVMQYYIGVLATEYRLLTNSGQTTEAANTKNELLYALNAVNRLDLYAENYFRINYSTFADGTRNPFIQDVRPEDLNGFFVRDDFGDDFKNKLPFEVKNISACFNTNGTKQPFEQSKDNVWHYLPNLALVASLVDDPAIVTIARDIAWRMVNSMHQNKTFVDWDVWGLNLLTIDRNYWRVINPVSGKPVKAGANVEPSAITCDIDLFGWDYGFAEAGNKITDLNSPFGSTYSNLHWGCSPNKGNDFSNAIQRKGLLGLYPYYDTFSLRALASVINFDDIGGQNTYDFLIDKRNNETIRLDKAGLVFDGSRLIPYVVDPPIAFVVDWLSDVVCPIPYEHLPLVALTLQRWNGITPASFGSTIQTEVQYYESLLNAAPSCGTYNFANPADYGLPPRVDKWAIPNRLVSPEHEFDGSLDGTMGKTAATGYFSGLDYMLLHNLYWINYLSSSQLHLSMYDGEDCSNQDNFLGSLQSCINYNNSILYQSCEIGSTIVSSRTIPSGKQIEYTAGLDIELVDGFSADNGSDFNASIDNSIPIYNKTTTFDAPFNSCPDIAPIISTSSSTASATSSTKSYTETPTAQNSETTTLPAAQTTPDKVSVSIAPNPNHGAFSVHISGTIQSCSVSVYSLLGVEVYSKVSQGSNEQNISLSIAGVYTVVINTGTEVFRKWVICN